MILIEENENHPVKFLLTIKKNLIEKINNFINKKRKYF